MRPAVYLDRDGTIIEPVHYLADPGDVRLVAGAAWALNALRDAGFASVVVTNQSAIARGLLTVEGLNEVQAELDRQLAADGARLDGWYFSPDAPVGDDRRAVETPDRKPGAGMLLRAARELDLDVAASWMIGDMISDMEAGRNAGCRGTILVRTGLAPDLDDSDPAIDHVADDLGAAVKLILAAAGPSTNERSASFESS